jgi:hypothetical protein
MNEESALRREVIIPMLPGRPDGSIHQVIADAAEVVWWIETGHELVAPEPRNPPEG